MSKLTTYQRYRNRWADCEECDLCTTRLRVALLRAVRVPAPILFVGEAPGDSEDVLGTPFVGPAGKLLDRIIAEAGIDPGQIAFTNLLGCIPKGEDGYKLPKMPLYAIKACKPRLVDCINVCRPKLVIWVGVDPKTHGPRALKESKYSTACTTHIIHPAAILRMSALQQGLATQRAIVTLSDAVEDPSR